MKQHVQAKAVESQTMQNEPLSHRKHLSHTEKSFFTDTQAAPQSKHSDSTPVIEAIERSGCRKNAVMVFFHRSFAKELVFCWRLKIFLQLVKNVIHGSRVIRMLQLVWSLLGIPFQSSYSFGVSS